MANWSAFSFSGWDPIGSLGEGWLNGSLSSHFTKKQASYNSALQYEYAQKYAENNPSWQRQGLENAGYNPLLAISNGIASPFGGNVDGSISMVDTGRGSTSGFDASAFARDKLAMRAEKAEVEILEAESKSAQASSALDAHLDKLRLEAMEDIEHEVDSPTNAEFRQAYRNAIQRDRYVNSLEHAIAEDAVNAIHGGSSAFSNIAHGMRQLRPSQPRRRR